MEFEKWRGIGASVGSVGAVLAWWRGGVILRERRACVGGMLAWVAWVACLRGGVLAWVARVY